MKKKKKAKIWQGLARNQVSLTQVMLQPRIKEPLENVAGRTLASTGHILEAVELRTLAEVLM